MRHAEPPKLSLALAFKAPRPVDAYLGRKAELERLQRWLDEGAQVVFITGDGGVGKTQLALRLALEMRDRYEFFRVTFTENLKQTILSLSTTPPYSLRPGEPTDIEALYAWNLLALSGYGDTAALIIDDFDLPSEQMTETLHSAAFADLSRLNIRLCLYFPPLSRTGGRQPTPAGAVFRRTSAPHAHLLPRAGRGENIVKSH